MSTPQITPKAAAIKLGFASALALVLANTIGAGVFTTSGFALSSLGTREAVLLAWVLGGAHALLGALAYADLAERFPHSGGEYLYVSKTLHPALGQAAGWVSFMAGFTAPIAGAALATQIYLERAFAWPHAAPWLASAFLLLLAFGHAQFPLASLRTQNVAVYAKAVAIAVLILAGAFTLSKHSPPSTATSRLTPLSLFGAFIWISYAYSGWNAAVYVASDVIDARTTLRRALVVGTLLVTLLYVGVNAVILYAVPIESLSGQEAAGAIAANALGGPIAGKVLIVLIAFALLSCASSMLLTGPRVYARMAEDGAMPRWFASAEGVPARAIALQAAASIVIVWIGTLQTVLGFVSFLLGLGTAASVLGHMRLLWRERGPRWVMRFSRDVIFVVITLGVSVAAAATEPLAAGAALVLLTLTTLWFLRSQQRASHATPR